MNTLAKIQFGKLTFDVFGSDDVRAGFERLNEIARGDALKAVAMNTFGFVQGEVVKHSKTGGLMQSLDIKAEGKDWFIGHDPGPFYAKFVHSGTKPHEIRPRNKQWLRFPRRGAAGPIAPGKRGDNFLFVFRKRVSHPGYKGSFYFVRAAARVPQLFAAEVEKRLTK